MNSIFENNESSDLSRAVCDGEGERYWRNKREKNNLWHFLKSLFIVPYLILRDSIAFAVGVIVGVATGIAKEIRKEK